MSNEWFMGTDHPKGYWDEFCDGARDQALKSFILKQKIFFKT